LAGSGSAGAGSIAGGGAVTATAGAAGERGVAAGLLPPFFTTTLACGAAAGCVGAAGAATGAGAEAVVAWAGAGAGVTCASVGFATVLRAGGAASNLLTVLAKVGLSRIALPKSWPASFGCPSNRYS
jgi:hypothetical protein